ncbi:MAG: oligopeptide/dipeptide ABC transporter ATP-binding protein [Planctomycetota bacterium]
MSPEAGTGDALLAVRDLTVEYTLGGELFGRGRRLRAADGVSFEIPRGRTLGLVGESGSGKSTVGRAIAGLAPVTSGEIRYAGKVISGLPAAPRRALARRIGILFQDPYGSLNPRMTAGESVWEAPVHHGLEGWADGRQARASEVLSRVGLPADVLDRYPHEFSGGQRQRVALARALAMSPELVVLDEPTSALDVSMAAQVLNLLADLQAEMGLTYLLIGHDLAMIENASDQVAVMYAGQIVESAPGEVLLDEAVHPYTRMLLETARGRGTKVPPAGGQFADSRDGGCRFAPRCAEARPECASAPTEFVEIAPGHSVRCGPARN